MAGTVKQNLLLGNTETIDDAVLVASLERVRLWAEFGPNGGLGAPVFEGGRNLSGGQVRRLGLARLLVRDRGIWIFDEATASLDPVSQEIVESFIRGIAPLGSSWSSRTTWTSGSRERRSSCSTTRRPV